MSEPRNADSATADALLKAIGQAARTPDATRTTDAAPTNEADDEALIANITRRVLLQQQLMQQQQASASIERAAPASKTTARARRPWWIGIAAAAASLAFAWMLVPAQYGAGPLPSYSAEVSGLDRDLRGATSVEPKPWNGSATIGNRLMVTLRPEIASESAVVAKLWHATGSDIELLPVAMQRSSAGTVRLDAVIGDELALAPGAHRLWLVVTRAEITPAASELLRITDISVEHDRYVLPITLEVRAR